MKTTVTINGMKIETEISEKQLKSFRTQFLEQQALKGKNTGYERVEELKSYFVNSDLGLMTEREYNTPHDDSLYAIANYYSDETVALNNIRADRLLRQLRRFAVGCREKSLNWQDDEYKYNIYYDYRDNKLDVTSTVCGREFGQIYFDSIETAELAIETFEDELTWYFKEYKDSILY